MKICKNCQKEYKKDRRITLKRWSNQLFCSIDCRVDFKKSKSMSLEEKREKRNGYMRNWIKEKQEKDPDYGKEYKKEYHKKNKEWLNKHSKIWRENIRKSIFLHYSNGDLKCDCCGEKEYEFLSLDHIKNDGAEHRRQVGIKGGIDMYMWIIKNKFPAIFQILCHNCNWSKRHPSGKCIHKRMENT